MLASVSKEFQADGSPLHAASAIGQVVLVEIESVYHGIASDGALLSICGRCLEVVEPLLRESIGELESASFALTRRRSETQLQIDLPCSCCPPFSPGLPMRHAATKLYDGVMSSAKSSTAAGAAKSPDDLDAHAASASALLISAQAATIVLEWSNALLELAAKCARSGADDEVLARVARLLAGAAASIRRVTMWNAVDSAVAAVLHEKTHMLLSASTRIDSSPVHRTARNKAATTAILSRSGHHLQLAVKLFVGVGMRDAALWCCQSLLPRYGAGADACTVLHPCPATHL